MSATAQRTTNMAGTIMFAALLGAAAGVLFAPKKGSETRADMKLRMREAKIRSHEQMIAAQERAQAMAQTAKGKAHNVMEAAKGKADDAAANVQQAADEARKQVDDLSSDHQSRNHRAS